MFVGPDFFRSADLPSIVIVGSGPAGLTLGHSLAERNIASLIIEAGEEEFDSQIQDDFKGKTTGDVYFDLDSTRFRQFGGSSSQWEGWCRPLDAWDFEAVPSIDVPGWPISRSDLDPYAARTRDILEIPEHIDKPIGDGFVEAQFVYSPPVRFGEKYGRTVQNSPYLHVALRTPLTAMIAQDGRVTSLEIVDANGHPQEIFPKLVVLACGGIENSRLLLWSNEVSPQRVVAEPRSLGRYWMEHPHEDVGFAVLNDRIYVNPRARVSAFSIGIPPERLIRFGALNAAVRFKYINPRMLVHRIEREMCATAPELIEHIRSRLGAPFHCGQTVKAVWEQAPNPGNRVALSDIDRDKFGIPRPHLFWAKTPRDYRTARVAFELVATHVVRTGKGMVKAQTHLIEMGGYPGDSEIAGHHHMGGTRMSASPMQGVVDANLRIHGMANAYVAGSSVFVRGGHANPTYTIVQLSLRLADHVAAEIQT